MVVVVVIVADGLKKTVVKPVRRLTVACLVVGGGLET